MRLMGGKTVDNIESLDILLYDGTRMTVGRTTEDELAAIIAAGGRRGQIYAGLRRLRDTYADLVRSASPTFPAASPATTSTSFCRRTASTSRARWSAAKAPASPSSKPPASSSPARSIAASSPSASTTPSSPPTTSPAVLAFKPIGLEGFDGLLVDFMLRKNLLVDTSSSCLPAAASCSASSAPTRRRRRPHGAARSSKPRALRSSQPPRSTPREPPRLARPRVRPRRLRLRPRREERMGGLGGLRRSPELLGAYLRDLFALINELRLSHAHVRPLRPGLRPPAHHLRLQDRRRPRQVPQLHRRGRRHRPQVRRLFFRRAWRRPGPRRAAAQDVRPRADAGLRRVQGALGPHQPHEPRQAHRPHRGLRPHRKPPHRRRLPARARSRRGSNTRATMAPSATPPRAASASAPAASKTTAPCAPATWPRARRSTPPAAAPTCFGRCCRATSSATAGSNLEVKEALDLCLSCKACKTECPVNVDMATWKAEFLAHHYEGRRHPLHHYAFGFMDRWARLASIAPSLANLPMQTPGINSLLKSVTRRRPPARPSHASPRNFRAQFNRNPTPQPTRQPVLLWPDTWNNYFHPQALTSATKLLTATGCSVQIPKLTSAAAAPSTTSASSMSPPLPPPHPRRTRPADRRRHPRRHARTKLRQRLPRRTHQLLPPRPSAPSASANRPFCSASTSPAAPATGSRRSCPAAASSSTATATRRP
jgi:hypothetical protein